MVREVINIPDEVDDDAMFSLDDLHCILARCLGANFNKFGVIKPKISTISLGEKSKGSCIEARVGQENAFNGFT